MHKASVRCASDGVLRQNPKDSLYRYVSSPGPRNKLLLLLRGDLAGRADWSLENYKATKKQTGSWLDEDEYPE